MMQRCRSQLHGSSGGERKQLPVAKTLSCMISSFQRGPLAKQHLGCRGVPVLACTMQGRQLVLHRGLVQVAISEAVKSSPHPSL